MNLDELRKGIKKTQDEILSALQSEGARAGADASALVENRIVSKGEKNNGQKFSPYSTKQVPAFLYFGRSRNSAGEAAIKKASKAKEGVSYSEFRRFNGLNTSVKNFQFTGEMWQEFGVKSVQVVSFGVVEVVIGGKNSRSNLLLGAHSKRENSELTEPSKTEIDQIAQAIQERIKRIVNKNV